MIDTVNMMDMLTVSTMNNDSKMMRSLWLLAALTCLRPALAAAELKVRIVGPEDGRGLVACSVHVAPEGFPESGPKELRQAVPWVPGGVTLVFSNLVAGRIAVAATLDRNSNGLLDKGLFGIPKEEWGVSGGVRPAMRAPKFDEAAFNLAEGTNKILEIRLQR
jgi:uncharacterized protein (DUF2141 family)